MNSTTILLRALEAGIAEAVECLETDQINETVDLGNRIFQALINSQQDVPQPESQVDEGTRFTADWWLGFHDAAEWGVELYSSRPIDPTADDPESPADAEDIPVPFQPGDRVQVKDGIGTPVTGRVVSVDHNGTCAQFNGITTWFQNDQLAAVPEDDEPDIPEVDDES